MTENPNISSLFDRSGNLRLEAMEKYLRGDLNPEERTMVDARLAESPFDKEALEGYKKHGNEGLTHDITEMEAMIMTAGSDKRPSIVSHGKARYFIAAAASLAAIVTVTAFLVFQFRQTARQPELAVVTTDTVVNQAGGLMSPAQPDTVDMHREATAAASERKAELPAKIGQVAPASSSSSSSIEIQEADTVIPRMTAPSISQIDIVEDEMTISEEISVEPGQIKDLESLSGTVAGVQRSSQEVNYIISDKGKRTMAQEAAMPVEATEAEGNDIFLTVEQMPSFPGGDSALISYFATNLHYPAEAKESNISGRVFVQFIVEKNGSVTNAQILRGIGSGCDEEALRVIKLMPGWNPGKQHGQAVRVQCTLPVKFSLTGE